MAVVVSEHASALGDAFLLPRQPSGLARALADKRTMVELARAHGVPTPGITVPNDVDDIRRYVREGQFPVMLKGIDGNRLHRRTGRKMVVVERPADLLPLYRLAIIFARQVRVLH